MGYLPLTVANIGKVAEVSHIIEGHTDGAPYHEVKDEIVSEILEAFPVFEGTALETTLNGLHDEWTKGPGRTHTLSRSFYMAAGIFEELGRQD